MIPTVNFSDRSKIAELINQAPGNYFGLKGSSGFKIRTAYYKGKREAFLEKIMDYLRGDLAGEGFYQVINGSNRQTEPIFIIQKGSLSAGTPAPVIYQEKENSDINLVKENAELKARLKYLEMQLAELQEELADSEKELSEAPDPVEKPNPWLSLAEQLAPAAGQIIAALAAKILTPQTNESPIRPGAAQSRPVEVRYPRPDAQFNPGTIPGQGSNHPNDLQGDDHPGSGFRDQRTETYSPF